MNAGTLQISDYDTVDSTKDSTDQHTQISRTADYPAYHHKMACQGRTCRCSLPSEVRYLRYRQHRPTIRPAERSVPLVIRQPDDAAGDDEHVAAVLTEILDKLLPGEEIIGFVMPV